MATPTVHTSLVRFSKAVKQNPMMSEGDVYSNLVKSGFFEALGYEEYGKDIRSQETVGSFFPDYYCVDQFEKTIFVLEAKKPSDEETTPLGAYADGQLKEKYVLPLKANYGVLTNGNRFFFYRRVGKNLLLEIDIDDLTQVSAGQATEIESKLRKPLLDFASLDQVVRRIGEVQGDPKPLREPLARDDFYAIFGLQPKSKFTALVAQFVKLLEYYHAKGYRFSKGAFAFWKKAYSLKLENVPLPWTGLTDKQHLEEFMFCLETSHALVSRLILAKVAEDSEFPDVGIMRELEAAIKQLSMRGKVSPIAYPITIKTVLSTLQSRLIQSVFEEDLFNWWYDGFRDPAIASLTGSQLLQTDSPVLEELGRRMIEIVASLYSFEFKDIEDILGDLYQQYFDRDTRKALGEFYTPVEVVDYILDSVGYKGGTAERILDPSCGSGTFVVQALKRYLASHKMKRRTSWASALDDLSNRPTIVGFDINPFAVLMSQVRYMIELIPYYTKAIHEDADFTLQTVPIFMTDSLWSEKGIAIGGQTQLVEFREERGEIAFTMELPIEEKPGKFVTIKFDIPTREHLGFENTDQYFVTLRALFTSIKKNAAKSLYLPDESFRKDIRDSLASALEGIPFESVINSLEPYAAQILVTIEKLTNEYEDGRLVKSMEDRVLAGVLKNFVQFDYVVGNPPWVSKKTKRTFLSDEYQSDLMRTYISAVGDFDTYVPFLERGLNNLRRGGKLGYIVSNMIMKTNYADPIRAILALNGIREIVDFADFDVFDEPTNYSIIIVAEKDGDDLFPEGIKVKAPIDCARVCYWDDKDLSGLMKRIRSRKKSEDVDIFAMPYREITDRILAEKGRVHLETIKLPKPRPSEANTDSKKVPTSDIWQICPRSELRVLAKMEKRAGARLGNTSVITKGKRVEYSGATALVDKIFVGIQLDGKDIYVVQSTEGLGREAILGQKTIEVNPNGMPEFKLVLETGLLRFLVDGKDIERWVTSWNNQLVIVPYIQKDGLIQLIKPDDFQRSYPKTYDYMRNPAVLNAMAKASPDRKKILDGLKDVTGAKDYDELSAKLKEAGRVSKLKEDFWWYKYVYRKNLESISKPKVIVATTSIENRFSGDPEGYLVPHNVRVYSLIVSQTHLRFVLGMLNSKPVAFYLNHMSNLKKGKTFEYIRQSLSRLPIWFPEGVRETNKVKGVVAAVRRLVELRRLQEKVLAFPQSYVTETIRREREFNSFRFRFKADVQDCLPEILEKLHGGFRIDVGHGQQIDSDLLDSRQKADLVVRTIAGRSFVKGGELRIQIPREDRLAEELLSSVRRDESEFARDIAEQEGKIESFALAIYRLTKSERLVVEDYLRRYSAANMKKRRGETRRPERDQLQSELVA